MNSFFPRHWPVRWRIAAVSAGLTLLILLSFALIVGQLATDKIRDDFRTDLRATANQLAVELERQQRTAIPSEFVRQTVTNGVVKIVDASGSPYPQAPADPDLGAPSPATEVARVGAYDVAAQRIVIEPFAGPWFVQYARPHAAVDSTVNRLWLLLGLGVLGGTVLAALAGVAVARRAMDPIASLTAAAREVAATRDPSKRVPMPDTDDEVAELARTLDQMLRELDAARSETEQMVQAQRDFVADASHELRTPLTSVLANLELLEARLKTTDGDPEDAEIVAGALGSSRRMRRLVSDLLLLARADAGRAGPRRLCELGEIAEGAVREVKALSAGHEIQLDAPASVEIDGNPDDLHRLVLNLVENAVRHTPPGTPVDVSVHSDGDEGVVDVSDAGPGIPEGLGEQIFSRFVRANGPADVAAGSGTGLGLAIVKAVAAAHGGRVDVDSSPAGGARLTVRMPLARSHEQALTSDPTGVV